MQERKTPGRPSRASAFEAVVRTPNLSQNLQQLGSWHTPKSLQDSHSMMPPFIGPEGFVTPGGFQNMDAALDSRKYEANSSVGCKAEGSHLVDPKHASTSFDADPKRTEGTS